MPTYAPVRGSTIPTINFKADRSKWTTRRWAEAVEAIHDELKQILQDLDDIDHRTPAATLALATYLGVPYGSQPSLTRETCQNVIMPNLRRVVYAEWLYCDTAFSSRAVGSDEMSQHPDKPGVVRIFFWNGSVTEKALASATYQLQSIRINLRWLTNATRSGNLLSNIIDDLCEGYSLTSLYKSLTPVLLHECLHLAHPQIVDVSIPKSEFPDWVDKDIVKGSETLDYLDCYSEYACQMLPRLERERFDSARVRHNLTIKLTPDQLPIKNSDSIMRAMICSWLSGRRTDLDFIPHSDFTRPKIRVHQIHA